MGTAVIDIQRERYDLQDGDDKYSLYVHLRSYAAKRNVYYRGKRSSLLIG